MFIPLEQEGLNDGFKIFYNISTILLENVIFIVCFEIFFFHKYLCNAKVYDYLLFILFLW